MTNRRNTSHRAFGGIELLLFPFGGGGGKGGILDSDILLTTYSSKSCELLTIPVLS